MKNRTVLLSTLITALVVFACSKGEALDPQIEDLGRASGPVAPNQNPMAPAAAAAVPASTAARPGHEGVVLERIHVPNYTYLRIELADGREEWTAVPKTEIEVGARVRVIESLVMNKFASPSLGRTFETIVFGTLEGGAAPSADAGAIHESPLQRGETPLPPGHPKIDP